MTHCMLYDTQLIRISSLIFILIDSATTHSIIRHKRFFSQLTLATSIIFLFNY
ncbi:hypothetical protein KSS87_022130 [Heliosperma pusillum]|nr:hypothetical protein KSS87_022130 [Heliosperma pusillum]